MHHKDFVLKHDSTWKEKNEKAGLEGMKVARGLALISYRHYETYCECTIRRNSPDKFDNFKSESYQRYQGEKLGKRFNAFSYYFLSQSMDSHNVGRDRESVETALKKIKAKTLVIGITTDILFPIERTAISRRCNSGSSIPVPSIPLTGMMVFCWNMKRSKM